MRWHGQLCDVIKPLVTSEVMQQEIVIPSVMSVTDNDHVWKTPVRQPASGDLPEDSVIVRLNIDSAELVAALFLVERASDSPSTGLDNSLNLFHQTPATGVIFPGELDLDRKPSWIIHHMVSCGGQGPPPTNGSPAREIAIDIPLLSASILLPACVTGQRYVILEGLVQEIVAPLAGTVLVKRQSTRDRDSIRTDTCARVGEYLIALANKLPNARDSNCGSPVTGRVPVG